MANRKVARTQYNFLTNRFDKTHGLSRSSEYQTWLQMRDRCRNTKSKYWPRWGGRGITIDPAWDSFEQFYRDMGPRPPGLTLERVDNHGPYSKANCRWATYGEQMRNTRRNNLITHDGRTQTITDWAREYGLDVTTLHSRLRLGWPIERALTAAPKHDPWRFGNRRK